MPKLLTATSHSRALLISMITAALLQMSAQGAIAIAAFGSHTQGGAATDGTAGGPYNISINATGSGDYLVVGVSTELGGTSAYSVTYDGNAMTMVSDSNLNQNKIFVLDLTETSYSGGNATLSFSWTATAGGDLGVGWASLNEGTLGAGETLGVVAQQFDSGSVDGASVDLTTTSETFNFINFNANKGAGGSISGANTIYSNTSFGSNGGGAAFEQFVGAETSTYSWDAANPRSAYAIAIGVIPAPIPEPSSALLGIFGGLLLLRRRRA